MSREPLSPLPLGQGPDGLTGTAAGRPSHRGMERITHMGKTADIREAVEAELGFDPLIDDAGITVRNINGDVALNGTVPSYPQYLEAAAGSGAMTLTGTVAYGAQRTAAERAVAALTGVRTIKDYIEIGGDADPVGVDLVVRDALERWAVIPGDSDVTVATRGNTVTLTGHVRTWAEHDAVVDAAWMAPGVNDVNDVLTVAG